MSWMSRTTRATIVVLMGCGATGKSDDSAMRRDSAGIEIVELRGDGWGNAPAIQLEPILTIGEVGRDDYEFGRIADAVMDGQRRILVLDPQAQQLQVYDSTGSFAVHVGGPGEGPGELSRWITDVMTGPGDTIFIPDYAQARINVYAPSGAYARTIPVPARPSGQSWTLIDGGFLYRGITISRDAAGRFQTWDALLRFSEGAAALDTIMRFDYETTELGTRENLRIPLLVNHPSWTRLTDGRIAWSALDRDRVLIHGSDGTLERMVAHPTWQRRPPSATDGEVMVSLLGQKLQLLGGDPATAQSPNVIHPELLPGITSVRAGLDGALWVQRMGPVPDIEPMSVNANEHSEGLGGSVWDAIATHGSYLGPVTVPPRFRITQITDDAVVGVTRDELDVERVMVLRMR
jgi:hypothetical protein